MIEKVSEVWKGNNLKKKEKQLKTNSSQTEHFEISPWGVKSPYILAY